MHHRGVLEQFLVVDIDLLGTFNVSRAAFDAWLKDHGGDIVNITAPFAGIGVAYQAHVAAAKMGVDSLTRTCAVEWGPKGIRVNGVAPGSIADTEGRARGLLAYRWVWATTSPEPTGEVVKIDREGAFDGGVTYVIGKAPQLRGAEVETVRARLFRMMPA